MRSSRLFRRVIAGLCAAAMLCGGMAASAAAPALPAAPAAVEATNAAPSDAELKTAFSKFTVTYDDMLSFPLWKAATAPLCRFTCSIPWMPCIRMFPPVALIP